MDSRVEQGYVTEAQTEVRKRLPYDFRIDTAETQYCAVASRSMAGLLVGLDISVGAVL